LWIPVSEPFKYLLRISPKDAVFPPNHFGSLCAHGRERALVTSGYERRVCSGKNLFLFHSLVPANPSVVLLIIFNGTRRALYSPPF
jgi:hypothetical protein